MKKFGYFYSSYRTKSTIFIFITRYMKNHEINYNLYLMHRSKKIAL